MIRTWLCSCSLTFALSAASLQAQLWTGATNSDWNTASNWNPAVVPTLLSARINTNSGNMPIVFSGVEAFPFALDIGFDGDSGANTKLTIERGGQFNTLNLSIGVNSGSQGSMLVAGGRIFATRAFVGIDGKGLLDVRDGANADVQALGVGYPGSPEGIVRVSGEGTYFGNTDGGLYLGRRGQVSVEEGARMQFRESLIDGGRLTVQGQGARFEGDKSFILAVLEGGRMEALNGGSIDIGFVALRDSNILVRGRGAGFETPFLAATGNTEVVIDQEGQFSTGEVGIADNTKVIVRGGASFVDTGIFHSFEGTEFLIESGGFSVVGDMELRGFARARGTGSNLFAASIAMAKGVLMADQGGTISAGPIQGGTIIIKGNGNGRGTVASTEFANNVILLDGGQVRALEDNWDFMYGRKPVVLEDGGGYFDTNRRVVQIFSPIVGGGSLTKVGQGVLYLSGELDYAGETHVQEGGLYLGYSTLEGSVKVEEGAFFGGIGGVEGSVRNAGFIDPGFSPGTLRIARNLTLESTSFLLLEIASKRNYDRLRVGGTVRLDGRLRIYLLGGFDPEPGDEFALLKADKIKGSFDSINPQFDATIVGNELVAVWNGSRRAYQNAASTDNQREAASALERLRTEDLGTDSDFNRNVRPILDTLAPADLRQAFEAIAPSQSAAFSSVAFARSKSWLPQMATRLEYARSRAVETNLSSLGAADMKDVVVANPERLSVWLDGSGVFSQTAGFNGLRTGDASTASGTVGADYKLSDAFTVGAYTGYVGNWTNFGGGSEVDSNGTRFGIYSTWQSGGFYLNSVVGGEWNAYDWRRRIVFPGLDRRASADTTGTVFETMVGGGYDWNITNELKLGVFSGLEYTLLNVDGFTESGAKALDLKVDDQNADSLRTNLGVQGAWSIPINTRILRPTLSAAWRHEYLDGSRSVGSQLAAGGGPGFNTGIPGSNRKDSLLLNGGFSMELTDNVTGYLYYTGDIDGTTDDIHSVNAGLRLQF